MDDRFAYSIFCDDIRPEIGSKMSMMGVYRGELHVTVVPALLSKLCIAVFCDTKIENPFKSLTVRVSVGDKVLQENTLPQDELIKLQTELTQKSSADDPLRRLSFGMQFVFSPFAIEKESTVVVTAIADGVEMIAGKLRLKHSPNLVL